MTTLTLYGATDQLITITGVIDSGGLNVVGATITGQIVDKTGVSVANGALTFADVTRISGSYSAILSYLFQPAAKSYTLQITGVSSGNHFYTEVACIVATNTL
jgi:hypothetical protein